ncbi:MAG: serpin family protein [Bacteroidales bacterium]|nr:serpin family protein [Bacteroidales bacterium]
MKPFSILAILFALMAGMLSSVSAQQEINEAAQGNNRFAFDLFEEVQKEGENVFFSPYSISSALAMTYTGAKGDTQKEMQQVFGFSEDKKAQAKHYHLLNKHLDTLNEERVQLNVANSLWCQQNFEFLDEFLNINKNYYQAGLERVDFRNNHPEARRKINEWVERETNHKISDLITEDMLNPSVRMVLANAIYFKGMWEYPFDKSKNRPEVFYVSEKRKTHVPFMRRSVSVEYYEDELAQVIELPYSGKDLSMMILLPQEVFGIGQLESKLDAELYEEYQESMFTKKVELWLPKFKAETQYNLNDPLINLGMKSAFSKGADFSGMTGRKELFISDVAHKAFIEVNEEGTEAAAATGAVMSKSSLVKKVEFKADHPFIYLIKDNRTNAILFMGRLNEPVPSGRL